MDVHWSLTDLVDANEALDIQEELQPRIKTPRPPRPSRRRR